VATLTHSIVPALPNYGSDNGIAALVEQGEPCLCHMIGSLGAELGERGDRHCRVPRDLRG